MQDSFTELSQQFTILVFTVLEQELFCDKMRETQYQFIFKKSIFD